MIAIFPKLAECAMNGNIERLACLVREHYGEEQTFRPRLNVSALCQRVGIPLNAMPLESQGALMVRDEKGQFSATIAVQEKLPPAEFAFTVAHLLGHYFLHVQLRVVRGDWAGHGFKEMLDPMQRFAQEIEGTQKGEERETDEEADAFAAALLMPSGMVKRAWARLQDKEKVAQFFGVSVLVLQRRLEVLGLMQSRAPGNFLAAEAKLNKPRGSGKTGTKSTKPQAAPPAQVDTPDNIANVNKMMAHSSYRPQAEKEPKKTTRSKGEVKASSKAESAKAQHEDKAEPATTKKGMARIRELAKRIDSSVE